MQAYEENESGMTEVWREYLYYQAYNAAKELGYSGDFMDFVKLFDELVNPPKVHKTENRGLW